MFVLSELTLAMETLVTFFQFLIFGMGIVAVSLSIYFIRFFSKVRKNRSISTAMQLFLMEQIVTAACTLIFSASSLARTIFGTDFQMWNSMDPRIAIGLRFLMFLFMILSTLKLAYEVRRISLNKESDV